MPSEKPDLAQTVIITKFVIIYRFLRFSIFTNENVQYPQHTTYIRQFCPKKQGHTITTIDKFSRKEEIQHIFNFVQSWTSFQNIYSWFIFITSFMQTCATFHQILLPHCLRRLGRDNGSHRDQKWLGSETWYIEIKFYSNPFIHPKQLGTVVG